MINPKNTSVLLLSFIGDSKLYDATFYTVCTIEYLKMTAIVETFSLKGMTIDVMDYPTCDPDGTYGFVQWDSNK